MKLRIVLLINLLINGLISSCNQQHSQSFEITHDTLKEIRETSISGGDILTSTQPKIYTEVHCMLLINYPKISYGEYVYKKYSIIADKSEFRVEREYRNKETNSSVIPYPQEVQNKNINDSNPDKRESLKRKLANFNADHYTSIIETYTVNQTVYTVYKHIGFNCYDPFCGSKHGHTTERTGVTYFSPEFGILISKDDSNMQFELLASIKEREVPYDLIIHIMKENKMDERIIKTYIRKAMSLKGKANS